MHVSLTLHLMSNLKCLLAMFHQHYVSPAQPNMHTKGPYMAHGSTMLAYPETQGPNSKSLINSIR